MMSHHDTKLLSLLSSSLLLEVVVEVEMLVVAVVTADVDPLALESALVVWTSSI